MIDPREHLERLVQHATEMLATLDRGETLLIGDGRLLARRAQIIDEEVCHRAIARLKERTAAEDKASQFATKEGERL